MSAQPLNTDITIFRSVRSYRQNLMADSIGAIIKRLRPLIMSVPGREIRVGALTRDVTTKDFSSFMGPASPTGVRGFPIVVGLLPVTTFATAQTNLPSIDFAFQIGQDKFLTNTAAGIVDSTVDLHADLRALNV